MTTLVKYAAVFRTAWRDEWAYRLQVLWNSLFLVIILFIFAQLWIATFHSARAARLDGFTPQGILWYLTVTETIVMGTPRIVQSITQEVLEGAIACRLTKPIGYVGYQFAAYVAQAAARMSVNLAVGGAVAWLAAGPPPFTWTSVPLALGALALSVSLSFALYMSVGLLAFWVEDARGIELIVSRLVMILGGMMIPLPFFPGWLARLCGWLPFQAIAYLPARAATAPAAGLISSFALSAVWLLVFGAVLAMLYRKGVKHLYVQGG
jgi:ABC-2 type transport system permease protein